MAPRIIFTEASSPPTAEKTVSLLLKCLRIYIFAAIKAINTIMERMMFESNLISLFKRIL